jgi:ABC-type bacteriocin/lantibiotic exporter with double-glycine peptidase domain
MAARLKPDAYQFFRPFPAEAINWKDLLKFGLRGTKSDFLLITSVGVAGGLLGLLMPVFTGVIFDKVIPRNDIRELYVLALAVFTSALSIAIFQLVRSFAMLRIESKMDFQLQSAFWDRILNMPVSFFRQYSSGELATKANTLSNLRRALSRSVISFLVSGLFSIFNYFLLFYYDPLLALVTTGIFFLSIGILGAFGLNIYRNQKNIIALQNKISGLLIQFLNSISKLKIAGAEVSAFSLWADKFSNSKKASVNVKVHTGYIQVFISVLPVIATLVIFAMAAYTKRIFSTGDFLAFYTAFIVCITIILQFGMAGISFFIAIPMYEDLKPILQTLPESVRANQEIFTLNGEIEMNEINFRYYPDGPLVIKNLSLHILPGEYVGIVGPSGSGKSTLIRLLLGFDTPESGSVYYDRQDLANYDPASVRKQIGSVLQESKLAPGPILSGITGISSASIDGCCCKSWA